MMRFTEEYSLFREGVNQQLFGPTVGKRDAEITSVHSELRFVDSF